MLKKPCHPHPIVTDSHLKAIEKGVPLKISKNFILAIQLTFTFTLLLSTLFLTIEGLNNPAALTLEHFGAPSLLLFAALPAFIIFSLSDAVMVDGRLRLKNILSKPIYIDPTNIFRLWHPFGPKSKLLIVVYKTKILIPWGNIILVSGWLQHAENIKRLLEHTQGPECILRKPGLNP